MNQILQKVILGIALLSSCVHHEDSDFKAPEDINKVFLLKKDERGAQIIGIYRSALDKELLIRSNIVQGSNMPQFLGLQSKIVSFSYIDGKLVLLEATEGHQHYSHIPQNFLLTEFPVLESDDHKIFFDFNSGMSKIFKRYYHEPSPETKKNTFESLQNSFLEKALLSSKHLSISQVGNYEDNNSLEPMSIHYKIEAYHPDPSFQSTPLHKTELKLFFHSSILSEDKTLQTNAMKIHPKHGMTFSIAANTPEEYREAIKEGVLYWNKILGPDFLKVNIAPKDASALDYDYNMIQWIDYHADLAYANAQLDPRTGQVLSAQIYLPKTFTEMGFGAIANMQKIKESEVSLKGFASSKLCHYEHSISSGFGLDSIEIQKGLAKNLLIAIVAHEVGHLLGLRHNFVGTLASEISPEEIEKIAENSLQQPIPLKLVSSSVMDYTTPFDTILMGRAIKDPTFFTPYDKDLINYSYKNLAFTDLPLHCTDEDQLTYLDCATRRAGRSIFEHSKFTHKQTMDLIPLILSKGIHSFTKSDHTDFSKFSDQLNILKPMILSSFVSSKFLVLNSFLEGRLLALEKETDFLNLTKEDQKKTRYNWIKQKITDAGGFESILGTFETYSDESLHKRFMNLIKKDPILSQNPLIEAKMKGPIHNLFLDSVSATINYFESFNNPLTPPLYIFGNDSVLMNTEHDETTETLRDMLGNYYLKLAEDLVFREEGQRVYKVLQKDTSTIKVSFPKFYFPFETRKKIWSLVATPPQFSKQKTILEDKFTALTHSIPASLKDPEILEKQNEAFRNWIDELETFNPAPLMP